MKILRVSSDFYPSVIGGLGIHAYEMSKLQAKMGHNVVVYTVKTNSELEFENLDGFKVVRFKPMIKIFGNSIVPLMFNKLIHNKNRFDVIHAHSHLFFSTNLCALVKTFGSAPLVITNHGLNSQTAPSWFQNIFNATGAIWTFKRADRIICYTKEEKRELVSLGISGDKIAVIHNGINTDIFIPKEDTKNYVRLLWIGRFTQGKGVEYLVDAFKILKHRYPYLKLLMVGKGPNRERIIRKINLSGLNDSIIIKDSIPYSEIPGVFQKSDVFILPSLQEGVPRTILEAMSCSIPIVCSELPQLVDIIKDCGFMVPKKDPKAIAERVSEILSNKKLAKELGNNGREKVVENFSWTDTVEKTIDLYNTLI